jgi:hypothetical protein
MMSIEGGVRIMKALTYGLNDEIYEFLLINEKKYGVEFFETEQYQDFIALNSILMIINANEMPKDEIDSILDFYYEIEKISEIIVFVGEVQIKSNFKSNIHVYKEYDQFLKNIKYHLLSAIKSDRKSSQFSNSISMALKILTMIKKNKCINTSQIASRIEVSNRTVLRYIESLRIAGEWIEYDRKSKCWKLIIENTSIILGDEIE